MNRRDIVKLLGAATGVALTGGFTVIDPVVYKKEDNGLMLPEQIIIGTLNEVNKFHISNIQVKQHFDPMRFGDEYINGLQYLDITIKATSSGPVDYNRLSSFAEKGELYI